MPASVAEIKQASVPSAGEGGKKVDITRGV